MSTPPELSFSRRVGAVNCTPDHLQCPRITIPSYIALAIPWDSASMHHSRATAMRAVFCQECVELGMFAPTHVPAASMTADVLTKWLSINDFAKHRGKLTNRRAQYKMLEQKKKI